MATHIHVGKKKTDLVGWGVLITLLLLVLVVTGIVKVPSSAVSSPSGTGLATTVSGGVGTLQVSLNPIPSYSCTVATTQNFQVTMGYPDTTKSLIGSNWQLTSVGSQTINSYSQVGGTGPNGVSLTPTSTATSSSANAVPLGSINCGTTYLITAGDNSGYFLNYTYANPGATINPPLTITSPKYTGIQVQQTNSVQNAPISSPSIFNSVTQSAVSVKVGYLVANAGQYMTSEGPICFSFAYNSQAISSVNFGGLPQSSASCPFISFNPGSSNTNMPGYIGQKFGGQNQQINFLFPSVANYQYSTGTGASSGQFFIPVTITTTSAYTLNELVAEETTPMTGWFNTTSGKVNFVYKNPSTGANLFSPQSTVNAFVLQTN